MSGEYDIVYSLPKEGRYRLWIRICGQDVKDSPFQVRNILLFVIMLIELFPRSCVILMMTLALERGGCQPSYQEQELSDREGLHQGDQLVPGVTSYNIIISIFYF